MSKIQKAPKLEKVQATIRQFTQQFLKEALEAELEEFLGYKKYERSDSDNSSNGYSSKTVKTTSGPLEIRFLETERESLNPSSLENARPYLMRSKIR